MRLLKTLKKKWFQKASPPLPEENGVTYLHHKPSRGNIGDLLCSPRHYFLFQRPIKGLHIVGGGVFVGLAVEKLKRNKIPGDRAVLWGAGQSLVDPEHASATVTKLPYLDWGIRDKASVQDEHHFVPCCSCLHGMLDQPAQSQQTLLFLNADPKITAASSLETCRELAEKNGWVLLFNNCSEATFEKALHASEHIITNSYHGSYWGLLAGRKVTMLGYSSKFIHLLTNVGLPTDHMVRIPRGDGPSLLQQLATIDQAPVLMLSQARDILNQFRERNLSFANRLTDQGIVAGYTLKPRVTEQFGNRRYPTDQGKMEA
jgi:hypothetical protein